AGEGPRRHVGAARQLAGGAGRRRSAPAGAQERAERRRRSFRRTVRRGLRTLAPTPGRPPMNSALAGLLAASAVLAFPGPGARRRLETAVLGSPRGPKWRLRHRGFQPT